MHPLVAEHHYAKTTEERIAPSSQYTAIGEKPPKSGLINVTLGCPIGAIHRHRRKTAEEL